MSKIMMITPQMHFSVFPHIILGHPPFTLPERHPGYFTTTLMQPISNVCQLLFPKPLSNLFSLSPQLFNSCSNFEGEKTPKLLNIFFLCFLSCSPSSQQSRMIVSKQK